METLTNVYEQVITEKFSIYNGDSCEVIKGIPDNSVGCIMYSPPFSQLYCYSNSPNDLGNSGNDQEFYQHFGDYLVPELYRVLQPGRLMIIHCMDIPLMKERDGVIGMKDFSGELIRLFESHNFIMHSPRIFLRKSPVIEVTRTHAIGLLHKQLLKDSAMCRVGIPDYLVIMRKPGENINPISHAKADYPVPQWQQDAECYWQNNWFTDPIWTDVNFTETLNKEPAREEDDEKHIAPLSLDIIRRALKLWSAPNDIVLSPFMGIGSEGYVAVKMGRRFVGIELKGSYFQLSVKNLQAAATKQEQINLFGGDESCNQ
jgi:DNA modification methylase